MSARRGARAVGRRNGSRSGRKAFFPWGERMSHFYLILIISLASFALIFTVQNVAAVDVTFLVWTISMSRALLILFTLSIGFLLGWFLHTYYAYRGASRKSEGESRK